MPSGVDPLPIPPGHCIVDRVTDGKYPQADKVEQLVWLQCVPQVIYYAVTKVPMLTGEVATPDACID